VEVPGVDQHLALVGKDVGFLNLDQLSLQAVWLMNFGLPIAELQERERLKDAVGALPCALATEERIRNGPGRELQELAGVLAEVFLDLLQMKVLFVLYFDVGSGARVIARAARGSFDWRLLNSGATHRVVGNVG